MIVERLISTISHNADYGVDLNRCRSFIYMLQVYTPGNYRLPVNYRLYIAYMLLMFTIVYTITYTLFHIVAI